jgi:filamentous hemagglutinin family protein
MTRRAVWLRTLAISSCALASASLAGPTGEQVVAGQVDIARQGAQTTITASNNAVIRFESFNVEAQETVRFIQPDERSRVLNQIFGSDPTRMDGSLIANGQVFIVNPSGVIFGQSARVNVGGLIAAAGSMSTQDFLADRDVLTNLSGPVENHGNVEAGVIGLFGQSVLNTGALRAPDGLVTLVAGSNVFIGRPGSNIVVKLEGGRVAPHVVDPGIAQRGTIVADEADMFVADLYSFAMSSDARVQARDIMIAGAGDGFVAISGELDASTRAPGATGGSIEVRGSDIALAGARLDASGAAGGGRVMLGGESGGTWSSAATISVDARSQLAADALGLGNGGHIMLDAIDGTVVGGRMSARGGPLGGDGGLIEMFGRRWLDVSQMPDVTAPNGRAGGWLLNMRSGDESRLSAGNPIAAAATDGPVGLNEALEWLECVMNRDCDPDRAAFEDPRLQSDEQQKLRRMYAAAFGRERQASGRRALLESVDAFRARPDAGEDVDGSELLRFLRANPEESSVALRYLAELSSLVAQWKRTQRGVPTADLGAACMLQIGLGIEGVSAAEIYEAVVGEPLAGETRCP